MRGILDAVTVGLMEPRLNVAPMLLGQKQNADMISSR